MSRFASRRNFYAEEQVLLQELVTLLDAREVPSDPIRRAQFWADYYRTGLTEGDRAASRAANGSSPVAGTAGTPSERQTVLGSRSLHASPSVSPVQDPLFTEEAA